MAMFIGITMPMIALTLPVIVTVTTAATIRTLFLLIQLHIGCPATNTNAGFFFHTWLTSSPYL